MVHRRCSRQIHHGDAVSIDLEHVSVSLLFVNKRSVSWSFVCQFILDMLCAPFARWHWAVCQISSLLHKRQHHRGLRIAQMSGQFSWTVRSTPRQRVVVRAHGKSRGWGGLCKICDVWTVLHVYRRILWHMDTLVFLGIISFLSPYVYMP